MRRRQIVGKIVLWTFVMIAPLWATVSYSVSSQKVANAQTICFELESDEDISKAYVAYLGVRYPFYAHPSKKAGNYYALVPTGYDVKPQKKDAVIVTLVEGQKQYISVPIMIVDGKYRPEHLKVKPSKAVFSPRDKKRIEREAKEAKKIYHTITQRLYIDKAFASPMQSKVTSHFGNKRLFNGVLKSFHSGTDFRAATGVPIVAANAGVVVIAKNRFFAGNSVVIDHGQGIFTQYYHLSKIKVKVGDWVEKGQLLGLAGATGRVTGPHLHFGVKVHGVTVDPMQFLETINLLY